MVATMGLQLHLHIYRTTMLDNIRLIKLVFSLMVNTERKKYIYIVNEAQKKLICPHTELNYGPSHYECDALPLSHRGD